MGWTAVVLLPAFCIVSAFIILNNEEFSPTTVLVASSVLLVDLFGLLMAVWRLVLGRGQSPLGPITSTVLSGARPSPSSAKDSE